MRVEDSGHSFSSVALRSFRMVGDTIHGASFGREDLIYSLADMMGNLRDAEKGKPYLSR